MPAGGRGEQADFGGAGAGPGFGAGGDYRTEGVGEVGYGCAGVQAGEGGQEVVAVLGQAPAGTGLWDVGGLQGVKLLAEGSPAVTTRNTSAVPRAGVRASGDAGSVGGRAASTSRAMATSKTRVWAGDPAGAKLSS